MMGAMITLALLVAFCLMFFVYSGDEIERRAGLAEYYRREWLEELQRCLTHLEKEDTDLNRAAVANAAAKVEYYRRQRWRAAIWPWYDFLAWRKALAAEKALIRKAKKMREHD
jgi:hypothetical protein